MDTERLAVYAVFFVNGVGWASWAGRLPAISDKLSLSEGTLGLALLGATIGLFVSASLTSLLVARIGSRWVVIGSGLVMAATLPLIGLAPVVGLFALALVFYGLSNGALDLASNAHAAGVERRLSRQLMSGFHAMFSAGAIIGAATAALLAGLEVPVETHAVVVGAVLGLGILGVAIVLVRSPAAEREYVPGGLAWPRGPLLGLAALAFCVLLSEGAVFDWSAIYLSSVAGAIPAVAAIGLAVFQATMMLGRLFGDRLAERFSPELLVRSGAVAGIGGLGLAILVPTPVTTLVGYAVLGLGLAVSFPLAMSAAARLPSISTPIAMGAVTAAGYTGFMAGPPAIGFVAEASNLRIALGVVLACLVGAALLAAKLRRPVNST